MTPRCREVIVGASPTESGGKPPQSKALKRSFEGHPSFLRPAITSNCTPANLTESWKAVFMKFTFDLPEDSLRDLKIRAVHEGKTFKALATELFRRGLAIMKAKERGRREKDQKQPSK